MKSWKKEYDTIKYIFSSIKKCKINECKGKFAKILKYYFIDPLSPFQSKPNQRQITTWSNFFNPKIIIRS